MAEFPIFKTKISGEKRKFNLIDPKEQEKYFKLKVGKEIEKLRKYLKNNTFVAYLLGKKNSGKGTYTKMFAQIVSPDKVAHFSVGDIVREIDIVLRNKKTRKELINFLENNYRGRVSLKDLISVIEKRDTKTLLPTEFILALLKREISKQERKAVFIDGFPRGLDQISYSLFFRDLINYRDDPDVFILINLPNNVLSERIKWRRVCPKCQTSRNLKLLPTLNVGYEINKDEFYLICDNPVCKEVKMVSKEGDEMGIEPIKERLAMDHELINEAFSLHGIPKVLLRNALPLSSFKKYVDDYEITPEYFFEWDEKNKKVNSKEKPWVVLDDEGVESVSLLAPAVVVSMIKQIVKVLNL